MATNGARTRATVSTAAPVMEDLHAGIFQVARPADVRGLIEARFQFDDRGDFFARGRFNECGDNQGMLAGAVQRLLDR